MANKNHSIKSLFASLAPRLPRIADFKFSIILLAVLTCLCLLTACLAGSLGFGATVFGGVITGVIAAWLIILYEQIVPHLRNFNKVTEHYNNDHNEAVVTVSQSVSPTAKLETKAAPTTHNRDVNSADQPSTVSYYFNNLWAYATQSRQQSTSIITNTSVESVVARSVATKQPSTTSLP